MLLTPYSRAAGQSEKGSSRVLAARVCLKHSLAQDFPCMKPFPKNEMSEIKRQLAAIGNNINQIAKIANTYDRVRQSDVDYIIEMQTKILLMMKRL